MESKDIDKAKLIELIKKYLVTSKSIFFNIESKYNNNSFDGFVSIKKPADAYIELDFNFRHTVAQSKENLKKIAEIAESVYKALEAFYAYVTWESGPIMAKGLENYGEFKKIYSEYKKTDKSSFNIKNFRKTVERHFGIKLD